MAGESRKVGSFEVMVKQLATVFLGLVALLLALVIAGGLADRYYTVTAGQRKTELEKQDAFALGITYQDYLRQEEGKAPGGEPAAAAPASEPTAAAASTAAGSAAGDRRVAAAAPGAGETTPDDESAPPAPPISKGQLILPRPNLDISDAEAAQLAEKAAVIYTTMGSMVVDLFPDKAPKLVKNFIYLARNGFYNGQCFYRILPGTFIETGSPNSRRGGTPGYWFQMEISQLHAATGTLVMVPAPDTAMVGSEIAIFLLDGSTLADTCSVFGRVVDRFDVVQKIAEARIDADAYAEDRVFITKIDIVDRASVMPKENIWAGIDPVPPAPNILESTEGPASQRPQAAR